MPRNLLDAVEITESKIGLLENLENPHEWGYRDPVDGNFVEDNAPYKAAEELRLYRERYGSIL